VGARNDTARRRRAGIAILGFAGTILLALFATGARAWSDHRGETSYYVSIGDSYAAGYRPDGHSGTTTGDGFAYQVLDSLRRDGNWELANFGCTGQTAYGMQYDNGCAQGALAAGGVDYPSRTQEAAALQFIDAHRDHLGLVTVAMGGNDIMQCLNFDDVVTAQRCAEQKSAEIRQSLGNFLTQVRTLVGDTVPIVGVSYINVFRATNLVGLSGDDRKAALSEVLFANYLNPTLRETYAQFGAHFVDSTTLAGGDLTDTQMSKLPDDGTVTTTTAWVCELTYYCSDHDPHPNREGHALIARGIEAAIR